MRGLHRDPDRGRSRRSHALQRGLTSAFSITGGTALLALLGITEAEVEARHLDGVSLLGAEDLVTMSLTVLVAAAVVYSAQEGGHVSVDLVGRFDGGRAGRVADFLARLLGAGATAVAALALFAKGSCGLECGEVTGSLSILHTPFYYALGASMATYSLLLASRMFDRAAVSDADDPPGQGV
ncbi:MAG: TRAP transporter small permease subunit [Gemmatimonadetes bacterium]|nr:TRAP transporter small permease subunit [Gemmatimonadota bacterium]